MNWTHELERNTRDFEAAFGHLDSTQLNWKPSPDRWSVGQCVDHLITTNSTYFPIFSGLKAGTYKPHFLGNIGFLANIFGKLILSSVQPENPRKNKTFPVFEPSHSKIPADIIKTFGSHQTQLVREMASVEHLANRVISSPANPKLVYRLGRVLEILVVHERRHLQQAKEVLAQLPKLP